MEVKFFTQPFDAAGKSFLLGEKIIKLLKLKEPVYNRAWFVASFAKRSGLAKLKTAIRNAVKNGAEINFILGINNRLTSVEALKEIINLGCKAKVFRNTSGASMGARLYCFESEGNRADVFVSSGNITEGGLYKNNELIVHMEYNLAGGDMDKYNEFKVSVMNLLEPTQEIANQLNEELIGILLDNKEIVSETEGKSSSVKKKTKAEKQKAEEQEDGIDMVSIVLPTGESIDVSLDEIEEMSSKPVVHSIDSEDRMQEEKPSEQNETVQQNYDADIEIEGLDKLESDASEKLEKKVMEELNELSEQAKDSEENVDADSGFLTQYEVIDIEQMLYTQSRFSEEDDEKSKTAISEEDMKLIKTRGRKKNARINEEPVNQNGVEEIIEIPKENIKKKFIISSSLNKANAHGIINAFFIQVNKLKGRGMSGEVRMPVASRDFSPEFWGWPVDYSLIKNEGKGNKKCKKLQTSCRIIDVENPESSVLGQIELYQEEGKTSFNLYSKQLIELNPEENDIIRIIRCPDGGEAIFQCELIRTTSKEYNIWEQFCSQIIKGSERRYGFA